MSQKSDYFLVTISILEGRHFVWLNMDSAVHVMVDDQKKCTNVKRNTDSPFFNEYFIFEFTTILDKFLDKSISFTVIKPATCWTTRKILGTVTLDIATVWKQPDHQFYHKWAILSPPVNEPGGATRGYLKVDIIILKRGDAPKIPPLEDTDEIESHLLLPEGFTSDRQRANFVFNIYRGENLCKTKYLDSTNAQAAEKDPPNSHVEVFFAGLKAQTTTKKGTPNPTWNERLILTELFPPLCQRIKIRLYLGDDYCEHYINLRDMSNDGEHGFLPTFGPAFVHFYLKRSNLEGYIGKLLMGIATVLEANEIGVKSCTTLEQIPDLPELWKTQSLLLFGVVLRANLIAKKFSRKPVSFELNFGNSATKNLYSRTKEKLPATLDNRYWYLDYGMNNQCVIVCTSGANFLKRLYKSNTILKIINEVNTTLREIENLLINEKLAFSTPIIQDMVLEVLDFLSTSCTKYQDLASQEEIDYETDLDKQWKLLCLREMENIKQVANSISNDIAKLESFTRVQELMAHLEQLSENAQSCWPNVYINMISGTKKVACFKFSPQDLVYSVVNEEMGKHCGKIQKLLLQAEKPTVACKLDIFLWLGLERHKDACLKCLPEGFNHSPNKSEHGLPFCMSAIEKHCRLYIYQAKLVPGFDASGLSDPFAQVTAFEKSRRTKVIKMTLNPVWDETIILNNLTIYGTKSHIRYSPPEVMIEVYDEDILSKEEFIGFCTLNPIIKFKEEPRRTPELSWHNLVNEEQIMGEILATGEFLELSEEADLSESPRKANDVVEIPQEIKPKLTPYRIEVFFWGLRDLHKGSLFSTSKAKVVLECSSVLVNSETLGNVSTNLNFQQPFKCIDISLPEERFAPPICIKMFDCKSFGRNILAGTHLVSLKSIYFKPLTESERKRKILGFEEPNSSISIRLSEKMPLNEREMKRKILSLEGSKSSTSMRPSEKKSKRTNFTATIDSHRDITEKYLPGIASKSLNKLKSKKLALGERLKENKEKVFPNIIINPQNKPKDIKKEKLVKPLDEKKSEKRPIKIVLGNLLASLKVTLREKVFSKKSAPEEEQIDEVAEFVENEKDFDWWTKYYASLQTGDTNADTKRKCCHLKIYSNELELQSEFNRFTDILQNYELYKGKRTGDETIDSANITGLFKGSLKIYKWPLKNAKNYVLENNLPFYKGVFQYFPSNNPLKFIARVYCIRGFNLRPRDISGKSDPYLVIKLGDNVIKDRDNYIAQQINPIFGRCFELNGVFSKNHSITVSVWDWDLSTSDDLIGETKIDVENRFYTKHRARCGLPSEYHEKGYCIWRDYETPTKILENCCKYSGLDFPVYAENYVQIAGKSFYCMSSGDTLAPSNGKAPNSISKDVLALNALHNWHQIPVVGCHIVPEHVETRPLYHPSKLGVEQGKIQLWIDIFPCRNFPPPPLINIKAPKSTEYELRVIIWNTEDVILEETDVLSGAKVSDIYITGWITNPEETQNTDIHYRSYTGEGNFNWRFIFRFHYLSTENAIVIRKKDTVFSIDETEYKIPCRLTLQVWDNDLISADDFLGAVSLDLSRLPRGFRTPEQCTLSNLSKIPKINLFKVKRQRGWWPFRGYDEQTEILAGKLEAEFELITAEEADKRPVGLERSEPQSLPMPNRPDTSFNWLFHPFKSIWLLWKRFRWKAVKYLLLILLITFMLAGFYALPQSIVKKMLHL